MLAAAALRHVPEGRRRPRHRAAREEVALLAPLFGTLLVLPPLVNLFVGKRLALFGVPLETAWLFAVWAAVILLTLRLARRAPFRQPDADEEPAGEIDPGPGFVRVEGYPTGKQRQDRPPDRL